MPLPRTKIIIHEPRKSVSADWVKLEEKLDRLLGVWREDDLLALDHLKTVKYRETETHIIILAKLEKAASCLCEYAGTGFKRNGLTAVQKIYDLPVRRKRVIIYFQAQRFLCFGCRKPFQSVTNEISDHHRMTARLLSHIQKDSLSTYKTFSEVAVETGVKDHVIRNIFTEYVVHLQLTRVIETSNWISIDEVYPTTKYAPRCCISDPLQGRILDLLVDNSQALAPWLLQLPDKDKVEVVSMDMCAYYRAAVESLLPKAEIVVDRYHVQKLLNKSLAEVLRILRMSLTATEKNLYMRSPSLLLKSRHKLKKSREVGLESEEPSQDEQTVAHWLENLPDLKTAYDLKEEFSDILNLSEIKEAETRTDVWLDRVREFEQHFYEKYKRQCDRIGERPFGNILKTIPYWKGQILNYVRFKKKFSYKVTNAFAENINRKISGLNVRGYGYNFEVLRAKIVFGGVLHEKYLPAPLEVKQVRDKRKSLEPAAVAPSSNICRIIKACEDSDKTIDLIENPMKNEEYAKRSMLEVIEGPKKIDKRGIPIRVTRKTTIDVQMKDFKRGRFFEDDSKKSNSKAQPCLFDFAYSDKDHQESDQKSAQDCQKDNCVVSKVEERDGQFSLF